MVAHAKRNAVRVVNNERLAADSIVHACASTIRGQALASTLPLNGDDNETR